MTGNEKLPKTIYCSNQFTSLVNSRSVHLQKMIILKSSKSWNKDLISKIEKLFIHTKLIMSRPHCGTNEVLTYLIVSSIIFTSWNLICYFFWYPIKDTYSQMIRADISVCWYYRLILACHRYTSIYDVYQLI